MAFRNGMLSLVRRSVGSRIAHVRSVAIVGPDGVGKSTALAYACRALASAFVDVRCRHWRPGVLPSLSRLVGTTDPAAEVSAPIPPRRHAGRWATVRLLYYWLDYLAGYWIRDRRSTSSEIPVNLYDRCALDMSVDPLRFGLPQSTHALWVYRWSRGLDLVILLHDSPERIGDRKRELAEEEIRRQFTSWQVFYDQGLVDQIIDVQRDSAEEVGRKIAIAIVGALSEPAASVGAPSFSIRQ